MTRYLRFYSATAILAMAMALPFSALAAGGGGGGGGGGAASSEWSDKVVDPDFGKALEAIDAKEWDKATEALKKSLARDDSNANAYNYLGFVERNRGNVDAAFKYYDKALALNPKHRGAYEYLGEAYLQTGNLAKAEEQLAKLDNLCFLPCKEYGELKEKVMEYKEKHK